MSAPKQPRSTPSHTLTCAHSPLLRACAGEDHGHFAMHTVAKDSSKKGNHLTMVTEPKPRHARIEMPAGGWRGGGL